MDRVFAGQKWERRLFWGFYRDGDCLAESDWLSSCWEANGRLLIWMESYWEVRVCPVCERRRTQRRVAHVINKWRRIWIKCSVTFFMSQFRLLLFNLLLYYKKYLKVLRLEKSFQVLYLLLVDFEYNNWPLIITTASKCVHKKINMRKHVLVFLTRSSWNKVFLLFYCLGKKWDCSVFFCYLN